MPGKLKTTVYLDGDDYLRLKQLARRNGRPPAELVREAVAEYAARHGKRPKPTSIGVGRSGIPDLAERDEEYLEGIGELE